MSLLFYLVTQYDWWFSVVCPRSVIACDSIGGNRLCVCFPTCAYARALLCALFNGNGSDMHYRKYLSSFSHWLSRLLGFALTVKLTTDDITAAACPLRQVGHRRCHRQSQIRYDRVGPLPLSDVPCLEMKMET